jgi:hypothetical protein
MFTNQIINYEKQSYVLDLPRGKDYKLGQVFASVDKLRGTKVKLKTTRQLLPGYVDPDIANKPLALENFLPLECCHRPNHKSISKCNNFSYSEALVKRTFYYQYSLFDNDKFSLCDSCGYRETERLTSYLFDSKQNRLKFRHDIKTDLLGGICCRNCMAIIFSYWLDIKHNLRRGFLAPRVSRAR